MSDADDKGREIQAEKVAVAAGQPVFYQGTDSDYLYILQQGTLEVLVAETETGATTPAELLRRSRRVAVIEQPGPVGELGCLLDQPRTATLRALTPAQLTRFPFSNEQIELLFKKNPRNGLLIGQTLLNRYKKTLYQCDEGRALQRDLDRINDNGDLLYLLGWNALKRARREGEVLFPTTGDPHLDRGIRILKARQERQPAFPLRPEVGVLKLDLAGAGAPRRRPGGGAEPTLLSRDLTTIFESILHTSNEHVLGLVGDTPELLGALCRHLALTLPGLNREVVRLHRELETAVLTLAGGKDALIARVAAFIDEPWPAPGDDELARCRPQFYLGLWDEIRVVLSRFVELWGAPPASLYDGEPGYRQAQAALVAPARAAEPVAAAPPKARFDWSGFRPNLFAAAGIESVEREIGELLVNTFRSQRAPFATDEETRKVKTDLARFYWRVYRQVMMRSRPEPERPEESRLLLRYGLFDDRLLDPALLDKFQDLPPEPPLDYPVYYADEWLARIRSGAETTSLNELGQTFQEVMDAREPDERKEEPGDPAADRVDFEINQVLAPALRMSAAQPAQAFPLLCQAAWTSQFQNMLVTRKRFHDALRKISELDFSLFYRETRLVIGNSVFFVRKAVPPTFVLLPGIGARALCWQELEGTNKHTPGRIFLPVFLLGDLDKVLLDALGQYRWELNRSCAGYQWADPVEGGVTGKYFDYLCNFKRNPELSDAAREECAGYFKKCPSSRDKFVRDYRLWMTYEQEGIQKLNKVTRKIFFNYVPFPRAIREKLSRTPAYEALGTVFTNQRAKKLTEANNLIKKFEKAQQSVPAEFLAERDFYSL